MSEQAHGPQRCGLLAIVGRPNVGKSTLLNALVGQKISITSKKAQTTRHRITGVRSEGAHQFVFVDTPGFQTKQSKPLNRTLNRTVQGVLADVDVVLFMCEAGRFTPEDERVLSLIREGHVTDGPGANEASEGPDPVLNPAPQPARAELAAGQSPGAYTGKPVILLANKLDALARRDEVLPWLQQMQQRHPFAQFVPLSARREADVQRLLAILAPLLPEQPWLYEADTLTDRDERFLAAELVREKLFRLTGDELPYTCTVVVEKFEEEGEEGLGAGRKARIAANIVVEREAHKGMVIGEGGERIKRIGSEARQDLERLMGAKVFLELWVSVRTGWADDEAHLRSYGYG